MKELQFSEVVREGVKKNCEKAVRLTACEEAEKCMFNVLLMPFKLSQDS